MKKIIVAVLIAVFTLTGCAENQAKHIDTLNVSFVPSVPADSILSAAEPLGDMLIEQLAEFGYEVDDVNISVGTSMEAVGEALTAGSTDIALVPGGTYVLYEDDGAKLALTAKRYAINVDSMEPSDWNKEPNTLTDDMVTYYHSLIVAGPSDKGQALQDKVNNGQDLTWDELADATWCVESPSSSAGYLYPTLWLSENYNGKTLNDLPNITELTGFGEAIGRLGSEQCDIAPLYSSSRIDITETWTRDESIFDATGVIGVAGPIYNDTIVVSENTDIYSDDFLNAVQQSFINIVKTPEGLATVAPYSHVGYEIGDESNYDNERKVQEQVIANI